MNQTGIFIVLEGTDGSGKGTQFQLLVDRLRGNGYEVATFDFPQYEQPSSYFVKEYLNGHYGTSEAVGPYAGSLFYALDRYQAAADIRAALAAGKVVIANRFTGSNMAHQGTKFDHAGERRGYFIWLDNLEFETLKIPRPDVSFVLRVPAETAQKLVDQKAARSYTEKKRDIHEADLGHMQRSVEVYDDMCQLFPKDFIRLDCVRDGELLDIDTISNMLWQKVAPLLPEPNKQASSGEPLMHIKGTKDNKYLQKSGHHLQITQAGHEYLQSVVSNPAGGIYSFNDRLKPAVIAAAMTRLAHRAGDLRTVILEEFSEQLGDNEQLLKRVITDYYDDSPQRLVGQHFVVENISNMLASRFACDRQAAFIEQPLRLAHLDKKDQNGNYKYYTPGGLDAATKRSYQKAINTVFDIYAKIVRDLTQYIRSASKLPKEKRGEAWRRTTKTQALEVAQLVLPVATTTAVSAFATVESLENLVINLLADELPEAQATGQRILSEARKVSPAFLEHTDKPEYGGATTAYLATTKKSVAKLAEKLTEKYADRGAEAIHLASFWPKNELDLVPNMLYEYSNLSVKDLKNAIADWSYQQKSDALNTYCGERLSRRHQPGRALENAHYSWDILGEFATLRDLERQGVVDNLAHQQLTPRHGFDTPKLIEAAGLTDAYETCFEISLKLYSLLQQKGYALEAQYATLLGHKLRWTVTLDARKAFRLHELGTSPQSSPACRELVNAMHEKLAEVHPLLASHMVFVNRAESSEQMRLAGERYSQYKLAELDKQNQITREHLGDERKI